MISKVYMVEDGNETRSYKGFDRNYQDAEVIALVFDSGEPEFWALDSGEESRNNFFQFLIKEYPHTTPGGIYNRW